MFKEDAVENEIAQLAPEEAWGGKEADWINWRTAERKMDLLGYVTAQRDEILSEKTRKMFVDQFGSMEQTEDLLLQFFVDNGGSIYFKCRNLQFRKDINFKEIEGYYENKLWEEDLKKLNSRP
jgi:hypothetical protein